MFDAKPVFGGLRAEVRECRDDLAAGTGNDTRALADEAISGDGRQLTLIVGDAEGRGGDPAVEREVRGAALDVDGAVRALLLDQDEARRDLDPGRGVRGAIGSERKHGRGARDVGEGAPVGVDEQPDVAQLEEQTNAVALGDDDGRYRANRLGVARVEELAAHGEAQRATPREPRSPRGRRGVAIGQNVDLGCRWWRRVDGERGVR